MTVKTVSGTLAAAVADTGTFTLSYPARTAPEAGVTDEGDFYLAMGHQLVIAQNAMAFPQDFDVTLGTASITITNRSGATWAAGASFVLGLEEQGKSVWAEGAPGVRMARMARADAFLISLGAPDALVANGIAEAQSPTGAGNLTLDGALVGADGVAVLDVPRNVIVDSGGADTAVLTVHGFDEYGVAMSEAITLNGTTAVAGKKAFKRITSIAHSATISNGAFVGTGDVLGLPVFLPSAGNILKELEDGAAASAGTPVAGIRTANGSTTTTGDVRGTYDPNSAADGAKVIQLIVALPDPGYRGIPQA